MSDSEDRPVLEQTELLLCRVCNVLSLECHSLYQPHIVAGELTTLASLLGYCANIQVIEEEHFLPTHICKRCVELLTQAYEFKRIALRTDLMLRKRHASASKVAISRSPSPEQLKHTVAVVDGDIDAEADAIIESASTDEYVYVLEETDSLEATADSLVSHQDEQDQPMLEEILENDLHFESDEPTVEVYEVDYDLAEDFEQEHEQALSNYEASIGVRLRLPQRRKSHNPALQCLICGKQLSTSNSFKYHMQLHGDNRPFVCSICGESFKTRNAYDGHITLHNPNNPNKCTTCGKIYRQASSLRSHLYTHSGVKPFTCDVCGKGLTQKSGYKKHMLTHTGEKPHSCDTCGRNFRYSSNLIAHKRSHTRKSPTNLSSTDSKNSLRAS